MDKFYASIVNLLKSLNQFFTRDVWKLDFSKVSHARAFFYQQLIVVYLVGRSFIQDRLMVRASALVYATLLSIVPLLAVMFSLLKGFGINKLEPALNRLFLPLGKQAIDTLVPTIVQFVDNVDVRALGGVGLVVLILSSVSIINNIESAFNDVWKINKVRNLQRRFSDYLSILIFGPLLVILVIGLTATLQNNVLIQTISSVPLVRFLITKAAPVVASWIGFLFLLMYIPNTKVRFSSALIGAVFAGTLWQLVNFFFTHFIVASYQIGPKAAIYAGFASLPLFLIWLYTSWAIILLGAEISYAHQNVTKLTWEVRQSQYSQMFMEGLALKIILLIADRFYSGEQLPTSSELADLLHAPERLVNENVNSLIERGFLHAVEGETTRYTLAKSPDILSIGDIIIGLKTYGVSILPGTGHSKIDKVVADLLSKYSQLLKNNFGDISIRSLLKETTTNIRSSVVEKKRPKHRK
jgi:membrane protein